MTKWVPMDLIEAFQLFSHFVFADKGHYFNKTMKYETIDKAIQLNAKVLGTPVFIRCSNTLIANWKVCFFLLRDLVAYLVSFVSQKTARFLYSGVRTSAEMWEINTKRDAMSE